MSKEIKRAKRAHRRLAKKIVAQFQADGFDISMVEMLDVLMLTSAQLVSNVPVSSEAYYDYMGLTKHLTKEAQKALDRAMKESIQ